MHGLLTAAVLRTKRVAVAQVPLAEVPGRVPGVLEDVGHRGQFLSGQRPAHAHERGTVVDRVAPSHELAAGGSAHGPNVKIGESDALRIQLVHAGRLEDWISVGGKVAIA